MKRLLLFALSALTITAYAQAPTIPTKLFDARNGNGVVDAGTTYTAAIVIPFGTAGSRTAIQNKQQFLDGFAAANGYASTVLNEPALTKQQFFLRALTDYMRSNYKRGIADVAGATAAKTAGDVVDSEVP